MDTSIPQRIKDFNANRVQAVLPLKYKTMALTPFRFFRGTCHLFYEDLLQYYPFADSPLAWISGDLHIENFGSYKGADRSVCFDINDFDEGALAPLLYEISRLLVSVELATTEIDFSPDQRTKLCHHLLHHYRHAIIDGRTGNKEWSDQGGLIKNLVDKVSLRKEESVLLKRTDNKPVDAKLLVNENLLAMTENEKQPLADAVVTWFFDKYGKKYTVTDVGFRIAGTGSIGVQRYCCLLESEKDPTKKKLIDVKESLPSGVLRFSDLAQPQWPNNAERTVQVQGLMQDVTPAYLSTFNYNDQSWVVRELQPTDDKISINKAIEHPELIVQYLEDLGQLTAAAQLRSSGNKGSAVAKDLEGFVNDDAWVISLVEWSAQYAVQVKSDHAIFVKAWQDGFFNR